MLSSTFETPQTLLIRLAERARDCRLSAGLTQSGLARRSGVSLGSLKRFESSGQISLESLLRLALVLERLDDFDVIFQKREALPTSLDALLVVPKQPKRGRIT